MGFLEIVGTAVLAMSIVGLFIWLVILVAYFLGVVE